MAKSNWIVGLCLASGLMLISGGVALAQPSEDGDRPSRQERQEARSEKGDRPHGDRPRGEERRQHAKKMLFKDIELSEEQKKQLRELHQEGKAQRDAWREAHKDELQAIREEMRAARENKDREAGQAAREKLRNLMADAPHPKDNLDEVQAILTPDQFAQFESNLEAIKAKHEERKEKRRQRMEERQNQDGERPDKPRRSGKKSRAGDDSAE